MKQVLRSHNVRWLLRSILLFLPVSRLCSFCFIEGLGEKEDEVIRWPVGIKKWGIRWSPTQLCYSNRWTSVQFLYQIFCTMNYEDYGLSALNLLSSERGEGWQAVEERGGCVLCPIILSLSGKVRLLREWNRGRKRKVVKRRLIVRGISVYVEDEKSYVRTFYHSKFCLQQQTSRQLLPQFSLFLTFFLFLVANHLWNLVFS